MALEYPDNLKYLDTHEYARLDEDEDIVTVGFRPLRSTNLGTSFSWNCRRRATPSKRAKTLAPSSR
jgi:glycine cleavage system H lipoate-binding protein